MEYKEYYIADKNGKSNCVIRSLCKVLNKDYDDVKEGLLQIAKDKSLEFNDIKVFEIYMKNNNIIKIKHSKDSKVKDLDLDNKAYIVFCYDKKDYYHMFPIINNIVFDKNNNFLNLYIISIYKLYE